MFNHSPELSLAVVGVAFSNTASTVTNAITSVEVPAGSTVAMVCMMQTNNASAGLITLTGSAGGFGTQQFTDFQSNGTDVACHSLNVFTVPNTMAIGTTLTFTRSTTWAGARLYLILLNGCTRLANRVNFTGLVAGNGIFTQDLLFNGGTVLVPHFIKSNINILVATSNSRQNVAGLGLGGQVPYIGAGMIAEQGGGGVFNTPNSGFQYLIASTIWRLAAPDTTQRFACQIGASAQTWLATQYRITPG